MRAQAQEFSEEVFLLESFHSFICFIEYLSWLLVNHWTRVEKALAWESADLRPYLGSLSTLLCSLGQVS